MRFPNFTSLHWTGDAARFVAAGFANTLLTVAIYQLLLFALPAATSYAIAWAVGLGTVAATYPGAVFRSNSGGLRPRLAMVAIYFGGLAFGSAILHTLVGMGGYERIAIFAAVAAAAVFNFLLMRVYFRA